MSGVQGGDFTRSVVERLNEVAKDRGQKVAAQWGDPVNGQKLTRDEQVQLWNLPNPNADPVQFQAMVAAGQHAQAADHAYPWRTTLIGKGDLKARIQRAQQLAEAAAATMMDQGGGGDVLQQQPTPATG